MTNSLAPQISEYRLHNRHGDFIVFNGQHLGHGTSEHPNKLRWFEVDLYITNDGEYFIHTQGKSSIEGEITYVRIAQTRSAFEVVELVTVNHKGKIYIPRQSSRALAQAAQWDDDIRDAYVNRAVV